ncbi:MAG: PKD domain-containing protein [Chitinophagaceae bacterium]|nr:PKD domain-containing protein [Chitinophagaceae bacterium]
MKKLFFLFIFLANQIISFAQSNSGKPLEFIENQGQWSGPFLYKAIASGGDIYLRKNGYTVVLSDHTNSEKIHAYKHGEIKIAPVLKYHSYEVDFLNASTDVKFSQDKFQKHYYNYFLGNNSSNFKTGIHPSYAVDYQQIYPGINIHAYSENGNLKYDFIVSPNSNESQIALQYKGLDRIWLEKNNLFLKTSLGEIKELAPYSYQFIDGEKKQVQCQYVLENNIIRFQFPKGYNKNEKLYIDPVLIFSTFTGSTADNWGFTATYDSLGNFYAGGNVSGMGYPVIPSPGAFQITYGGGGFSGNGFQCDAAITVFDPTATTMLYSTYLGGSDNDQPHSMVVDNQGNLVVVGKTYSTNFPMGTGLTNYDNSANGAADMFVVKFNGTGTALLGATYIGGSGNDGVNVSDGFPPVGMKHNYGDDARSEVIVDNANNIFVASCTNSSNFPTVSPISNPSVPTPNGSALAGSQDGVLFKFNPSISNLLWSSFIGGANDDACYVLSLDKTNPTTLYVGGGTQSTNFYGANAGTINPTFQGVTDGFLLKLNTTTNSYVTGTFIGTNSYDQVYGVQTDDSNHVYVMGQTQGPFPVSPASVYSNLGSSQFIAKYNNSLSGTLFSTVYGSGTTSYTNISPVAFLVDRCENIYVSGWGGNTGGNPGNTNGMPVTAGALKGTTDGVDFYFICLSKNAQSLLYATYWGMNSTPPSGTEHVDGGTSRFDPNGIVYQSICGACGGTPGYPTSTGVVGPNNLSGNCNLAALKIDFQLQDPDADALISGPTKGCVPFIVNFINNSTSATNYIWDFGDGSPVSTATSPTYTYNIPGTYTVSLIAVNPNGCTQSSDTDQIVIIVSDDSIKADFIYVKLDSCDSFRAQFTNTSLINSSNPAAAAWTTYFWDFGDGTTFNGPNPPIHNFPTPTIYTVTLTMVDTSSCDSFSVKQVVIDFSTSIVNAGFLCPDSVCMPANISFIDQSTNATGWAWDFGGVGNSTAQNPNFQFPSPGVYTIRLISANPNSCNKFDTIEKVIVVLPSPTADFSYSPNPPEPNKILDFTNLSTDAISYLWDFGDGSTSTLKDPKHLYKKDGYYNVCLTASNEYGCKDSVCKTVRGYVIALVDVATGFSPNGDGANDVIYVQGYGIEKMVWRIYNRWGELVFESTNQESGWDGKYKGVDQEMEVYAYSLSVDFFDGTHRNKKGNITLIK